MVSQDKLIKKGIYLTDNVFDEILKRLSKGIRASDTLEAFITRTKDYTMNNPLVVNGFKDDLLDIILRETNNHKFSRPAQKELVRLTIENRVGDLIVDVGDDIRNSVRDIVKHGYNNNLSQDEIAENITHRISAIKNTRARTIARTEIARTATASDYVINKERGATHFTVDCRKSCCDVCRKDYNFGKVEYSINQVKMLPPRHPNCRCVANFFIKEGVINEGMYPRELTPLKRVGNFNPNDPKVNPKKEFESISKTGVIVYTDENGNDCEVKVRCKKSSIVDFGDEGGIGKKLSAEECYQYNILDENGKIKVTIYKSKNHNQFSMSQLMNVYDNLDKILIKDCTEIILTNHTLGDSGGFVLPSNPHRIHIMSITDVYQMESVLIHEMAHSYDLSNGISNSEEYIDLAQNHPSNLNPLDENDDHYFEEDFAYTVEELYSDFLPPIEKTIYLYTLWGKIKNIKR